MLSDKTRIGMKRLYFLILLFIFSFPSFAFAFTWQDVENLYNSCLASKSTADTCWIEPITTNSGSGYMVWKRANSSSVSYSIRTDLIDAGTGTWVSNCGYDYCSYQYLLCDGTPKWVWSQLYPGWKQTSISVLYFYSSDANKVGRTQWTTTYCDGNTSLSYYNSPQVSIITSASPCFYNLHYTGANCKSFDTLFAASIPTDKCLNKLTNTYESCLQNCKDPVEKTNTTETCNDSIDNNCNGEIDEGCKAGIELPMTVYQCADGVGAKTYDTTSQNICTSGCALASATMVLNYYLNQSGLPMIDVLNLNEWLNKNYGYYDNPKTSEYDGAVDWKTINRYPNPPIFYDDVKSNERLDIDTKTALLNSQLMDGYPIILKVKTSKGTTHFVVATGINGNTWDIIDPGHQDAKTTLVERYNNTFYGIRVYKPRQ